MAPREELIIQEFKDNATGVTGGPMRGATPSVFSALGNITASAAAPILALNPLSFKGSLVNIFGAIDTLANGQNAQRLLDNKLYNLSIGANNDDGSVAGYTNATTWARANAWREGVGSEKRKEQEFKEFLLNLSIQQQIEWHREQAEWHREQAKILREKIEEYKTLQTDHFHTAEEYSDILEDYQKTGKLDKERAWKALKDRGVHVDKNADVSVYLAELERQKKIELLKASADGDAIDRLLTAAKQHEQGAKIHEQRIQDLDTLQKIKEQGGETAETARETEEILEQTFTSELMEANKIPVAENTLQETAQEVSANTLEIESAEEEGLTASLLKKKSPLQGQWQSSAVVNTVYKAEPANIDNVDDKLTVKPTLPVQNLS